MMGKMIFKCPMAIGEFNELYRHRSLQYPDAEVLCTLIRNYKLADILELGTFIGLSAKVMAMAVRENGFGHITSVDLWGPGERFAGKNSPCRGELLDDDDLKIITLITADELEYLKSIPAESLDMVFEDTNHAARMIKKAVPLIERALRPGGIALFHNSNWQSVKLGLKFAGVTERLHNFDELKGCTITMLRKEKNE